MKRIVCILLACVMAISIMPAAAFAASKPSAPTISSYTAISNSSVKITWGSVSGATKYRVDRRRTDEENYKTLTSTCTATSYTDSGLKSAALYYYRVYAINSAGTSSRSVTYATYTKPDTPVISKVNRDGDTQLTITWGTISGASKYKIVYRRGDQSDYQTLTSSATGTSYTHTGLTPNAKYWYRVYAIKEGAVGNAGSRTTKSIVSDQSETVGNFTKMSRPSNSIDNDNPSHVILSWKQAYGGNEYAYDIYRKAPSDSGFTKIKNTKDLSYTDYGLTPGVVYKYKINTVTADGYSCTWSDEFYAAPKVTTPISLTAYDLNSVQIDWGSIPITSETNCQYMVRRSANGSIVDLATTSDTYYVDSNLSAGETYTYWVQLRDPSGNYITSTYEKSITLDVPNLGTGFYASIMNKSSWKPIKIYSDCNVALGENAGTADTLWRFDRDSDGSYKISSATNGYVLDAYGWGNSDGTNVATSAAHDDNKSNQRWYLFEQDGGYVILPSYNTSLAADIDNAGTAEGTNLQLWTRNNSNAQIFQLYQGDDIQIKAPTISVDTGSSDTETAFAWDSVPGASKYKVLIYQNSSLYKEEEVTSNSYSVLLAPGAYTATVTAMNYFESKVSDSTSFTVGCNHSYSDWTEITKVSCTENGLKTRKCSICGNVETEIEYKTGHSYETQTTPATCTESGETKVVCKNCGDIQSMKVIAATGHSFPDEWTVEKAATCTEEGSEYHLCANCGEKESQIIEMTEHDYVLVKNTEPSGSQSGIKIYECSLCGKTETEYYWPEKAEGTLSIEDINVSVGGSVMMIPVSISDNPGITGFTIRITYDRDVFEPISTVTGSTKYVSRGALLKNGNLDIGSLFVNLDLDEDNYPTQVQWTGTTPITDDGVLFYIGLRAKDTAATGEYSIGLEYSSGEIVNDTYNIMPYVNNGTATVSDVLMGDVNSDGDVNVHDRVHLLRYLAHWTSVTLTDTQKKAADLYKDDKITIKDSVKLSQMLVLGSYANNTSDTEAVLTASAESSSDELIAEIGNVTGKQGGYVDVPIEISRNPGIAGVDIKLEYNNEYLTPVSVSDSDLLSTSIASNIQDDTNDESVLDYVTICGSSSDNTADTGTLCTVRFKINDNAAVGDSLPITVSDESSVCSGSDTAIEDVNAVYAAGSVEVGNADVNGFDYVINSVTVSSNDGSVLTELPSNGDCNVTVDIQRLADSFVSTDIVAAAYDADGILLGLTKADLSEDMLNGNCTLHIGEYTDIAYVKIMLWDSLDTMQPLAEYYQLE